jgi:prephenate dehydrogenase
LERTTRQARSAAEQIVASVGAHAIEIAAAEHDRALAATSHFPFLLSSALALSTPQEFAPFVGTGFRSTSRLAGTPSHMTMDILKSNRENILNTIQSFRQSLDQIEILLQNENYPQLGLLFDRSRAAYHSLLTEN